MNQTILLSKSSRSAKKWQVELPNGKTIHFGAQGYQDFTQHKDPSRQKNYLARHKKDPTTVDSAGFWARELLWSKPSLKEAIQHVQNKAGVKIQKSANK